MTRTAVEEPDRQPTEDELDYRNLSSSIMVQLPEKEKDVAMYIFLNKDLHMSTGKAAAQASHAAIEAYRISQSSLIDSWYEGGHYTKLVMQAANEQSIYTIQRYLEERGFESVIIIDEGVTEISPHQVTALGVQLVDRNIPHVKKTFSQFELYRDSVRLTLEFDK